MKMIFHGGRRVKRRTVKLPLFLVSLREMNRVKLICIDVDGTLINSRGLVGEADRLALKRAANDLGIPVAIVSGRSKSALSTIRCQLDFETSFSSFNGLYVESGGEVLLNKPADPVLLGSLLPLIRRERFVPVVFGLEEWYMEDPGYWYDMQRAICGREGHLGDLQTLLCGPSAPEVYKIVIKNRDPRLVTALVPRLEKMKSEGRLGDLIVVSSGPNIIEFIPNGGDKADTLDVLAAHFGVAMENVIAFGDYYNDVLMLRRAGIGVCMGNGVPEAICAADYVTLSNEECGISVALGRFVFGEG